MTDCSSRHPSSELMEAPDQVSEENQKEKVLLPEDSKPALRRGKWTPEEEAYVAKIIHDFDAGTLPIDDGTTLRSYLSEKLNCDPMRITKKFTGDLAIGKRVFTRLEITEENRSEIEASQQTLLDLEKSWLTKLDEIKAEAERKVKRGAFYERDISCGLGINTRDWSMSPQDATPENIALLQWIQGVYTVIQSETTTEEVDRLLAEGKEFCCQFDVTWPPVSEKVDSIEAQEVNHNPPTETAARTLKPVDSRRSSAFVDSTSSSSSSSSRSSSFSSSGSSPDLSTEETMSSTSFEPLPLYCDNRKATTSGDVQCKRYPQEQHQQQQAQRQMNNGSFDGAYIQPVDDYGTTWGGGAAASTAHSKRRRYDTSENQNMKSPPLSPTDHAAGGLLVGFLETLRRNSLDFTD